MNELAIIDKAMIDARGVLTSTIQNYQWSLIPDSQLHAAKAALTKSDYIMKIAAGDPDAVHDALIKGAILGVDLTESKRQAYLLPRKAANGKTIIQLQVGYKGVEAIHQRMGVIDRLSIRVVYKNDTFEWSGDDAEKPQHNADWFSKDRGDIEGAYCVTYFPDKSIQVMTAPISEIYEKHRDISDSWKQYKRKIDANEKAFPPPWVSHEKAMIEKTMAYIASKQWPANIRNTESSDKILETLHEVDTADYQEAFVRYSDSQKQAFDEMIEKNDALGMFLYMRYLDAEYGQHTVGNDLYNSFPRGQKVKGKEKVNELTKVGAIILAEIQSSIDAEDSLGLMENIDDITDMTKNLLWSSLEKDQQDKMKIMLEGE